MRGYVETSPVLEAGRATQWQGHSLAWGLRTRRLAGARQGARRGEVDQVVIHHAPTAVLGAQLRDALGHGDGLHAGAAGDPMGPLSARRSLVGTGSFLARTRQCPRGITKHTVW